VFVVALGMREVRPAVLVAHALTSAAVATPA
jgi:hypothetical protein